MEFKERISPEAMKQARSILDGLIKEFNLNLGKNPDATKNFIVTRALAQTGDRNTPMRTKILNVLSKAKPELAEQIRIAKIKSARLVPVNKVETSPAYGHGIQKAKKIRKKKA